MLSAAVVQYVAYVVPQYPRRSYLKTQGMRDRTIFSLVPCLFSSATAAAAVISAASAVSACGSSVAPFHHKASPRQSFVYYSPSPTKSTFAATLKAESRMKASSSVSQPTLKTKLLTLLFVRRANPTTNVKEVLLGMKKRGFGQGKWNGFGGKVETDETIKAAALRELEEESCLKASDAELRGKITFTFLTIPEVLKVHVFEALGPIKGEPQETEEMKPQWYAESEIPYEKMWADDKYWLPLFLEGTRFKALFEFDDESTLLRYDLDTVPEGEEL